MNPSPEDTGLQPFGSSGLEAGAPPIRASATGAEPGSGTPARLTGWGRTTVSPCTAWTTASAALAEAPAASGLIAHGGGRSYGDCALNTGGGVLLTGGQTAILGFDEASGIARLEPGVTFAQLLATFLPRGWLVPVTPGTGLATMGGAVAHDVHGKNHEVAGSFGQHVTALVLLAPDGRRHALAPGDPLFAATVGGLGLTGVITEVGLRLRRVPGPAMRVTLRRMADLDAFLAGMAAATAPYSVGWIDGTAAGRSLGRGILETAEHDASTRAGTPGRSLTVPFDLPGFALNPLSVRAFNAGYFRRVPAGGRQTLAHVQSFLYPLDRLLRWNRIYGRRGFYQFQCVLPFAGGAEALRDLLELIARSGQASFLSVLKRLGEGRAGLLSFPRPGYTLALDFPARAATPALYQHLAERVLHHGGRLYLGKDALLGPDAFRAMYPEWRAFAAVVAQVDPERRMQSDMRRRLGL